MHANAEPVMGAVGYTILQSFLLIPLRERNIISLLIRGVRAGVDNWTDYSL